MGELGNGTYASSNLSIPILGVSQATAIAAGGLLTLGYRSNGAQFGFSCALFNGGTVQCWGDNSSGQLGNGTVISSNTRVAVNLTQAIAIAAGGTHACALLSGGAVQCWGDNTSGQLESRSV